MIWKGVVNTEQSEVTEHGRIRKLVNEERKYLWNPLSNVTITVRIKGLVAEESLREAIHKTVVIHPLLSSKVIYDRDNLAWFHNDNIPEIPFRIVKWKDENQWQEELAYENRIPFKVFEGPLIRFVLIKSLEVSDFMVYCQHAICDGRSLVYLIRDILTLAVEPKTAVNSLLLPPILSSEGLSSLNTSKGYQKSFSKFIINGMNKRWKKDRITFDQEDFDNIHKAYWQEHEYKIELIELSREQTLNFTAKCRQHYVTVTAALGTAFLAAHYELCGSIIKKVALPIDLRNRMKVPASEVLCFYVSRIMFKYNYSPKESFWQNVRKFNAAAKNKIESENLFEPFFRGQMIEPTLIDAMSSFGALSGSVPKGFSRYDKLSSFALKKKNIAVKLTKRFSRLSPGLVLTNLGKLPASDVYGDLQIEKMYFAPSTDERFPLVIGALTAGGRLVVTVNYVGESRTELMKKIRDRALVLLKE